MFNLLLKEFVRESIGVCFLFSVERLASAQEAGLIVFAAFCFGSCLKSVFGVFLDLLKL